MQDVKSLVEVGKLPCWLHGDLTPANILVQEVEGASSVSLIDFGDCGHGDPLFDIVPLHLITFRYPVTPPPPRAYCNRLQSLARLRQHSTPDLDLPYRENPIACH